MRMMIKEYAISDFALINQLMQNKELILSDIVNVHISSSSAYTLKAKDNQEEELALSKFVLNRAELSLTCAERSALSLSKGSRLVLSDIEVSSKAVNAAQGREVAQTVMFNSQISNSLINSFENLSNQRPRLKKVGIYTQIILKNLTTQLSLEVCLQLLSEYVQGIGWDDLQYVSFINCQQSQIEFHIVFNRVTPSQNIIDLNCLGAKWQQYEVLQKSLTNLLKSKMGLSSIRLVNFISGNNR